MNALCYVTPYLYYSALISLYLFSLLSSFSFSNSESLLISKHVYLSIYIIRIAQLQGNHGYFLYEVVNCIQDEMKLENMKSKLQSSFILLQFIHLSILHYTTLEQPQELIKLVNTLKVVQWYLPQQADIDKILDIIKRRVLKGTHLPLTIKEIQAGYLASSFFKGLYRYLAQNVMPHKRHARHKVEALAESFILLDSLLFKLVTIPDKEKALLAIP